MLHSMAMPIFAYAKIKPLRQAKGLNQSEIAAELGISRPTYVLMEQGDKEPTITQLYTLSRLLSVEPGELCANLPTTDSELIDYPKFKDLVMACASQGADTGTITKTKLAALTYLADFAWYHEHSRPMTGANYRHASRGPVADDFFRAIDELFEEQAIALEPRGTALIVRAIEKRPVKHLSEQEVMLITKICATWRTESTDGLHGFIRNQNPWKISKQGDLIPYEAIIGEPKTSLY
jgi:transcriptional regulator with XRE-family HTH domain